MGAAEPFYSSICLIGHIYLSLYAHMPPDTFVLLFWIGWGWGVESGNLGGAKATNNGLVNRSPFTAEI